MDKDIIRFETGSRYKAIKTNDDIGEHTTEHFEVYSRTDEKIIYYSDKIGKYLTSDIVIIDDVELFFPNYEWRGIVRADGKELVQFEYGKYYTDNAEGGIKPVITDVRTGVIYFTICGAFIVNSKIEIENGVETFKAPTFRGNDYNVIRADKECKRPRIDY